MYILCTSDSCFTFNYYVEHIVKLISPLCLIDGLIYVIIFKVIWLY